MKKSNVLTIKLSGVNLNRIYKECVLQNIKLSNIYRKDYKNILFDINKADLSKIQQVAKKQNYQLFIIKQYAFAKLFSFLSKRVGIVVGAAIFLFCTIASSFFVYDIKIYGNKTVSNAQILECLEQSGVKRGLTFGSANWTDVEENLLLNLEDVSLCSIIKKGSTIIVNIKEKTSTNKIFDVSTSDIVATHNMTIESLQVVQGTALKKVGDTVKAGETVVAGYFVDAAGKKKPCNANAKIRATIWFSKNYIYPKTKQIFERTGKKVVQSQMQLFDICLPIKNQTNNFEFFEQEITSSIFNNNMLPIKIITTTFYQTEPILVEQNFAVDKDTICNQLEGEVLLQIPADLNVSNVWQTVTENDDSFVVTCYASANVEL